MIKRYRPTTLRIYNENCPAALEFFRKREGGADQGADRLDSYTRAEREIEGNEQADIGIAFHAVMHAAAEASKKKTSITGAIEATGLIMTNQMRPERALAGLEMAKRFLYNFVFDDRMKYEHGLAFDMKWGTSEWDAKDVRLRMVLDVYGFYEESTQDGDFKIAVSEDYKTGWGATESIVDSIQMKCHSTALFLLHGKEADFIEVRVQATRFNRVFSKRWDLNNPGDIEDLEKRQKAVEFFMMAGDQSEGIPRIGPGCILCDFKTECPAFQGRLAAIKSGDVVNIAADPIGAARDFAIIESEFDRLHAGLKQVAKTNGITDMDFGDRVLGFHVTAKRTIKDAPGMVDFWLEKANAMGSAAEVKAACRGLLKAMRPGVTQFDNMAKVIARAIGYKSQKEAIADLGKTFCETQEQVKFGFKKREQLERAPGDEDAEE